MCYKIRVSDVSDNWLNGERYAIKLLSFCSLTGSGSSIDGWHFKEINKSTYVYLRNVFGDFLISSKLL